MAVANVLDINGEKVGEIEIKDEVFDTEVKPYLIHDVIKMQLANRRSGTAATKTRSFVSGGGRKPYRQKGTGRARQGSSRAPVHVGGGKVFGPHPRSYYYLVPKKVRRGALRSALSIRFGASNLMVLDKLELDGISTKRFSGIVKALKVEKPLFVIEKENMVVERSARNIPNMKVLRAEGINVYDVMKYGQLVLTVDALRRIEEVLSK